MHATVELRIFHILPKNLKIKTYKTVISSHFYIGMELGLLREMEKLT
jgi:hypothetical protein